MADGSSVRCGYKVLDGVVLHPVDYEDSVKNKEYKKTVDKKIKSIAKKLALLTPEENAPNVDVEPIYVATIFGKYYKVNRNYESLVYKVNEYVADCIDASKLTPSQREFLRAIYYRRDYSSEQFFKLLLEMGIVEIIRIL